MCACVSTVKGLEQDGDMLHRGRNDFFLGKGWSFREGVSEWVLGVVREGRKRGLI